MQNLLVLLHNAVGLNPFARYFDQHFFFTASDTFSSTFNTQEGTLPMGELSTDNRIALQSGLTEYASNQTGFSRCTIEVRDSDVDNCPSVRRILQKRRRRRETLVAQDLISTLQIDYLLLI